MDIKCDFCKHSISGRVKEIKIPVVCQDNDWKNLMVMQYVEIKPMKICSMCANKMAHILEIMGITYN